MSALVILGEPGSIAGSLDKRLGIVAVKLKCRADDLGSAITGALPDVGINLPEWRPRTFNLGPGGQHYLVDCTLEGHLTPEDADGTEYSLEGATGQEGIDTHPEYLTLLDVYGGNANAQDRTKTWPETLPGTDGERNPMHGVLDYLAPSLLWTKKWVAPTLSGTLVRDLGTLSWPPGNPPELSSGRNWLLIRARATFRGNIWQIEATWQISGPYGFVREMYKYY